MHIFLIAILLTLGLFRKQSDEQEIRTRNASWVRTFVYGILSFALWVFYMKTNEVPVIKQGIDISAIQSATDKNNKIQDKASVYIVSRFDNNALFEDLFKFGKGEGYDENDNSVYENSSTLKFNPKNEKYGGVNVKLSCRYDSVTTFVTNNKNHYLVGGMPLPIPEYNHCYEVSVIMSHIPSILPFQAIISPTIYNHVDSLYGFNLIFTGSLKNYVNSFRLLGTDKFYGHSAIVFANIVGTHNKIQQGIYDLNSPISSNVQNTMNIFSAADMSQCIYEIGINTPCELENIYMNFDVPVELLPSKYKPDQLDAYDIVFSDSTTLSNIKNHFMILYCKFPTLQNIQIVRQLVLTTILTALLALFFSNFYYSIRRNIQRKKIVSPKLGFLKVWKLRHYWDKKVARFIVVVFSILGILTLMRLLDYSILINSEYILLFQLSIIAVPIIILIYFIFKLRSILKYQYIKCSEEENSAVNSLVQEIYEMKMKENEEEEKLFSEHISEFGDTEIEEADNEIINSENDISNIEDNKNVET